MRGRKQNGWPRDSIAADECPCYGFRRVTKAGTVRFDKTVLTADGLEELAGDMVYIERMASLRPGLGDEYYAWCAPVRPSFWQGVGQARPDFRLTPVGNEVVSG